MPKKPLYGALAAHGIRQQDLCRMLDRSQVYVSDRMKVRKPWELDEVYALCKLLEIPLDKIPEYFSAPLKILKI
jgi:hypothetical protein